MLVPRSGAPKNGSPFNSALGRIDNMKILNVSIGGDVYSEAVTSIVTLEGEAPKIREIEYDRP